MLSGVSLSCYQACKTAGSPITARVSSPSNFPNLNSLTNKNSAPFRWKTAKQHDAQRFARQRKTGFPARRAAP
ncbi:hypothetical protein DF021_31045 [Burkholderia stagnalis]|uniref:Uncharacterized protein n=1 Tax=Burkholderia stagnalis TaxID=1503054 RepID=A0ABX9YLL8_9BURK|nr:hypothetical protein DF158_22165 [Burkholderia stagnalis]RQQ66777.1 hypothetical protein DF137_20865 [Burkholderia stagnalis]RQQ68166.1 hypothetical protein DF139_19230 [Burkholderia stagnalis]RQQ78654.1 hypothetical protein DF138_20695 [Burkholderia stagnalis]RQQ88017.1 hypothetical protein DF134_21315 [Burkholderia stagnalis]